MKIWKYSSILFGAISGIIMIASLTLGLIKLAIILIQSFNSSFAEGVHLNGTNLLISGSISFVILFICSTILANITASEEMDVRRKAIEQRMARFDDGSFEELRAEVRARMKGNKR
jgi:hypothetical protein